MPVYLELVPVGLLVGGFVLVVVGRRQRARLALVPDDWRTVDGTVVELRREPGPDGGHFAVVTYRGPDGLARRVNGAASRAESRYVVGETVPVLLDPTSPRRARLAPTHEDARSLARLFVVLGAVALVLGVASAVGLALT